MTVEKITKIVNPKIKTICVEIPQTLEDQNDLQNTKYQNIIYYKYDRDELVESANNIHIDFFKAMSEMEKLDWVFQQNYIGFENKRKHELVQFIRQDKNRWYAEIPMNYGINWDGYCWIAYSDNETVSNMMKLFFEEMPWFGMLDWKMRRYSKK